MQKNPKILYCHCAYAQVMPLRTREAVLKALQASGVAFEAVADLCELAAQRDPRLKEWSAEPIRIAACFPRTVKWLFHLGQAELPNDTMILNMRNQGANEIIESLLGDGQDESGEVDKDVEPEDKPWENKGEWVPWFPVIDYQRCTNCKQCLNFCLFGVYGVSDEEKVEVKKPANCKLNCPACARVCPKVAIIFPKYEKRPVNGDEVRESDLQQGKVGVDISTALEGDVYTALRNRGKTEKTRFAADKNKRPNLEQAINSLRMARLQKELDIPDEVISSLTESNNRNKSQCGKDKEKPPIE